MKHHCHCGLGEKIHRLKAKRLGMLGGLLVVLHLLFHVAEALVVPAIFWALRSETAATTEMTEDELETATWPRGRKSFLRENFQETLLDYSPLKAVSPLSV